MLRRRWLCLPSILRRAAATRPEPPSETSTSRFKRRSTMPVMGVGSGAVPLPAEVPAVPAVHATPANPSAHHPSTAAIDTVGQYPQRGVRVVHQTWAADIVALKRIRHADEFVEKSKSVLSRVDAAIETHLAKALEATDAVAQHAAAANLLDLITVYASVNRAGIDTNCRPSWPHVAQALPRVAAALRRICVVASVHGRYTQLMKAPRELLGAAAEEYAFAVGSGSARCLPFDVQFRSDRSAALLMEAVEKQDDATLKALVEILSMLAAREVTTVSEDGMPCRYIEVTRAVVYFQRCMMHQFLRSLLIAQERLSWGSLGFLVQIIGAMTMEDAAVTALVVAPRSALTASMIGNAFPSPTAKALLQPLVDSVIVNADEGARLVDVLVTGGRTESERAAGMTLARVCCEALPQFAGDMDDARQGRRRSELIMACLQIGTGQLQGSGMQHAWEVLRYFSVALPKCRVFTEGRGQPLQWDLGFATATLCAAASVLKRVGAPGALLEAVKDLSQALSKSLGRAGGVSLDWCGGPVPGHVSLSRVLRPMGLAAAILHHAEPRAPEMKLLQVLCMHRAQVYVEGDALKARTATSNSDTAIASTTLQLHGFLSKLSADPHDIFRPVSRLLVERALCRGLVLVAGRESPAAFRKSTLAAYLARFPCRMELRRVVLSATDGDHVDPDVEMVMGALESAGAESREQGAAVMPEWVAACDRVRSLAAQVANPSELAHVELTQKFLDDHADVIFGRCPGGASAADMVLPFMKLLMSASVSWSASANVLLLRYLRGQHAESLALTLNDLESIVEQAYRKDGSVSKPTLHPTIINYLCTNVRPTLPSSGVPDLNYLRGCTRQLSLVQASRDADGGSGGHLGRRVVTDTMSDLLKYSTTVAAIAATSTGGPSDEADAVLSIITQLFELTAGEEDMDGPLAALSKVMLEESKRDSGARAGLYVLGSQVLHVAMRLELQRGPRAFQGRSTPVSRQRRVRVSVAEFWRDGILHHQQFRSSLDVVTAAKACLWLLALGCPPSDAASLFGPIASIASQRRTASGDDAERSAVPRAEGFWLSLVEDVATTCAGRQGAATTFESWCSTPGNIDLVVGNGRCTITDRERSWLREELQFVSAMFLRISRNPQLHSFSVGSAAAMVTRAFAVAPRSDSAAFLDVVVALTPCMELLRAPPSTTNGPASNLIEVTAPGRGVDRLPAGWPQDELRSSLEHAAMDLLVDRAP